MSESRRYVIVQLNIPLHFIALGVENEEKNSLNFAIRFLVDVLILSGLNSGISLYIKGGLPLGLSKSGLKIKDHFWTVPKVVLI